MKLRPDNGKSKMMAVVNDWNWIVASNKKMKTWIQESLAGF
jgi:ribosome-binding protein aMBF1 (putative translation factor)